MTLPELERVLHVPNDISDSLVHVLERLKFFKLDNQNGHDRWAQNTPHVPPPRKLCQAWQIALERIPKSTTRIISHATVEEIRESTRR